MKRDRDEEANKDQYRIIRMLVNKVKERLSDEVKEEWSPPFPTSSVSTESIRLNHNIDLHDTEAAPYNPPMEDSEQLCKAYTRLSECQRSKLHDLLKQISSESADNLRYLHKEWKSSSSPRTETQTYEYFLKLVFEIDANVRGGSPQPDDCNRWALDESLLQKVYEITQAFLKEHYSDTVRIHRGIRKKAAAELFSQALDSPDQSRYIYTSSVVSNYSTLRHVGSVYSDGIVLRFDCPVKDILVAVDHLRPENEPSEAEIHRRGGTIKVPATAVWHTGLNGLAERPIRQTVKQIKSPRKMELIEHREVGDFIEMMTDTETRLRTAAGAKRVNRWFDEAVSSDAFNNDTLDIRESHIEYVTTIR